MLGTVEECPNDYSIEHRTSALLTLTLALADGLPAMYHAPRAGPRAAGTGFGITVGFQIPHGARRRDRRPGRTARNDAAPNGEQRQPHADSSLNF